MPQPPNKLSLNQRVHRVNMADKSAGSAPDRDVNRGLEARRRDAGAGRSDQVHRLRGAEEPPQRAHRGAAALPLEQGHVPALLGRESRHIDQGQLAPPQLLGDQVLDRGRDPGPVGRGRPGGGLALEDPDVAVGDPEAAQQPGRLAARIRSGRVHQPPPLPGGPARPRLRRALPRAVHEQPPLVISPAPGSRRLNASISGPATNSANVEVATTRSCSGAPCAARTAACASAPSTTIWDAVPTSREPPGVSVMPTWLLVISWS